MRQALLGSAAALVAAALPPGVVFAAAPTIESLRADAQALIEENEGIVALADQEEREISDDELATIEANKDKVLKLTKQISARESASPALPSAGRRTTEVTAGGPNGTRKVPATPKDTAKHNFVSFGEFALGVRAAANKDNASPDYEPLKKVRAAATTYGNEAGGADGGFLVPPDFSTAIWEKVQAEDPLMNLCAQLQTASNSMALPKDETTPWGTNGVRVFWEGEAGQDTATKPSFDMSIFRLMKLTALVPVTDENLEDAVGLESWLRARTPGLMAQAINTGIVAGSGVGQPLGILNSASRVTIAKENSQDAGSIWFANVNKMWSGMYAPWRRNAVWLINQDAEVQLDGMQFSPGSTVPVPVYMPPGGLSGQPYASLKGRPVIPSQACSALGSEGDIILVDLKQYWVLQKAAGMRSDVSIHLYFDQSITTFRFVFRLNGQPAWGKQITQQNSSNPLSWAVTVAARA